MIGILARKVVWMQFQPRQAPGWRAEAGKVKSRPRSHGTIQRAPETAGGNLERASHNSGARPLAADACAG